MLFYSKPQLLEFSHKSKSQCVSGTSASQDSSCDTGTHFELFGDCDNGSGNDASCLPGGAAGSSCSTGYGNDNGCYVGNGCGSGSSPSL
ncbi:MAG: hypothetical protein ABIA04_11000 [Pseudomonadota bacterium]